MDVKEYIHHLMPYRNPSTSKPPMHRKKEKKSHFKKGDIIRHQKQPEVEGDTLIVDLLATNHHPKAR